jgi:predicted kinase
LLMSKPTLYIFIGYPGAGKTTAAQVIAEATGAVHLWADDERHKLFPNPTHSQQESHELYRRLNKKAEELLNSGQSVLYDTNFNFKADRQLMHDMAERHGAQTLILWLDTAVQVARDRAVGEHTLRNNYTNTMSNEQFETIVSKLEPPEENEKVLKIDDNKLNITALINQINNYLSGN